jgi:hypothetical protein
MPPNGAGAFWTVAIHVHRHWPLFPAAWWLVATGIAIASCQPCMAADPAHVGPWRAGNPDGLPVLLSASNATVGNVAKSAGTRVNRVPEAIP